MNVAAWILVGAGIAGTLCSQVTLADQNTMTRPIIPPTSEVAAIAATVRDIYQKKGGMEALHHLWSLTADRIIVLQQPFSAMSGVVDGKYWANKFPSENQYLLRGVKDFRYEIPEIIANGYEIEMPLVIYRGTMADGSKMEKKVRMVFMFDKGKVVHFTFATMMADPKEREEQNRKTREGQQAGGRVYPAAPAPPAT